MRDVTVRELLESMFPDVLSDERLERVCSKPVVGDDIAERGHHHDERLLREEDQRECLLSARVSELPCLLHFIRTQLDAPDFSTLPLALKDRWSDAINLAMYNVPASFGEDLAAAAHELEVSLGDYQEQLVSDPNAGLQAFLTVVFGTERALFEELPLMKHLPPGLAARNYVELRKRLRRWAAQTTSHAAPTEGWFWPFLNKTAAPSIDASATSGQVWGRAMWFETSADLIDIQAASEARQAAAERTQAAELKARVHMMSWRIFIRMRSFVRSRRDKMSRRLQHHARRLMRARREREGARERAARQDAAQQALLALGEAKGKATLRAALAEARSLQEHLPALSDGIPAYELKLEEWEEQERAAKHVTRRRWLAIAGSVAVLALALVMPWHGGSALAVASNPGIGARAGESLPPSSWRLEQLTPASKPATTPASPLASSLAPSSNEQPDVPPPTPQLEFGLDTAPALEPSLPEEQVPLKRGEAPSVDAQPAPPQGGIGARHGASSIAEQIAEAYEVAREKLHYARKLRDAGEITQETYLDKERQIMSEF